MWTRESELIRPVDIQTPCAKCAEDLALCIEKEVQAAWLFLLARPVLPIGEWAEALDDMGTDTLNDLELIEAIVANSDGGRAKSRTASWDEVSEDALDYLLRLMDVEEDLLVAYGRIMADAGDENTGALMDFTSESKACHIRQLCRMLCEMRGLSAEAGAEQIGLDGCSESIEYYTDEKSGRLCCRAKGCIEYC